MLYETSVHVVQFPIPIATHQLSHPLSLRSPSRCPRASTRSSVLAATFATPMESRSRSQRCSELFGCRGWDGGGCGGCGNLEISKSHPSPLPSLYHNPPHSPHHWVAVEPLYENQLCGSGAVNSLKAHNSTRANESKIEIPSVPFGFGAESRNTPVVLPPGYGYVVDSVSRLL